MNIEYRILRDELNAWQERRFTVLSGSVALVTGILGLKMIGESNPSENWTWASALLLTLLASACALIWYAGRANAEIAEYLRVFHESSPDPCAMWETRLGLYKKSRRAWWSLNRMMILIYLGLALLAVLAPMLCHRQYRLNSIDWVALSTTGGLFAVSLVLLGLPLPKEQYFELWTQVKEEQESGKAGAPQLCPVGPESKGIRIWDRFYAFTGWGIVALGALHMLATLWLSASTPVFRLWFLGSGMAIVLVGAVNLLHRRYGHSATGLRIVCRAANIFATLFALAAGAVSGASVSAYVLITGVIGGALILSFVRFAHVPMPRVR